MMTTEFQGFTIRDAGPEEYGALGELTVQRFAALEGFAKPGDQPEYYALLRDVATRLVHPSIRNLVAVGGGRVLGGCTFVGDIAYYSPHGIAAEEPNAAGMRLLAVAPEAGGKGIGRALTEECIRLARELGRQTFVLHSTHAMPAAWHLYTSMGFMRAEDLDFMQGDVPVLGFRLPLRDAARLHQVL
jgi:ribosomal protein S18 acetylase RimI-like enzyme